MSLLINPQIPKKKSGFRKREVLFIMRKQSNINGDSNMFKVQNITKKLFSKRRQKSYLIHPNKNISI